MAVDIESVDGERCPASRHRLQVVTFDGFLTLYQESQATTRQATATARLTSPDDPPSAGDAAMKVMRLVDRKDVTA